MKYQPEKSSPIPDPATESLVTAWNRWVTVTKLQDAKPSALPGSPLRLTGGTTVRLHALSKRERSTMDRVIRRGYAHCRNTRWHVIMQLIMNTTPWRIGYIGTSKAELWFPEPEIRDECLRDMQAYNVLDSAFDNKFFRKAGTENIIINIPSSTKRATYFTGVRLITDRHMRIWEEPRHCIADSLLGDDAQIVIPFTSSLY